ncbi:MAG: DNA polymerase III subunit gamma/tau [Verrucomicrobiota bacterium]|nr:DNA polymerase III subunit gamma/tau [Verrucomicrobiota bacterium]
MSQQQEYLVLARRYRPQRFQEVVGQEAVITTLQNALSLQRTAHAYLFAGCRGVGKTTLARLFAKALNCSSRGEGVEPCNECPSCQEIQRGQSLDVIEIDGASHRGIDDIRLISETALYAPMAGCYKIYIIDEVHMLTKEAFNALLKTLEEPPERAKFLLATTEPHKVPATILSRCHRFELKRISSADLVQKLDAICRDLSRSVDTQALHLIASFAEGSLRDAESLLDQLLAFAEGPLTAEIARSALGLVSQELFFSLDQAFSKADCTFAFRLVETLFVAGKDPIHFFTQLIEHVRLLCIARISGTEALPLPSEEAQLFADSARLYLPAQCLYLLDYLLRTEMQLSKSASPRTALEGALLHYIQSKHRIPPEVLIRRLSELEASWKAGEEKPPAPSASKQEVQGPVGKTDVDKVKSQVPTSVDSSFTEKKRCETIMRFAAVELEGNLIQ